MPDVWVGKQVYGLTIRAPAVYLSADEVKALDEMIKTGDGTPVTVEQGKAARSFIRQALGFVVTTEGER